jgi:hypothetical protein
VIVAKFTLMTEQSTPIRVFLIAIAFAVAQLAFVSHDYTTHDLSTDDSSCEVCLLGGNAKPAEVHIHDFPDLAIRDQQPDIVLQDQPKQTWFSVGSPRAPPRLIA